MVQLFTLHDIFSNELKTNKRVNIKKNRAFVAN